MATACGKRPGGRPRGGNRRSDGGCVSDFERVIADALRLFGWRYAHFRPALTKRGWRTPMTGDKGFPDFVAVRGNRLLVIEVKGDRGYPDAEQRAWHHALMAAGVEVMVARSKDWDDIKHMLAPAGVEVIG